MPGGSDLKTICNGYLAAEGAAGAKFLAIVQKLPDAMTDPSKAAPAMTELKGALGEYRAGLAAQAAKSADGELKAAIETDVAIVAKALAAVEAAGTDVTAALNAMNTPDFQKLGEKVKTLCDK
ncbi:MAG TPA: hypothetical protein VF062_16910 [Candidatus Limnocylindrales bacterium]